MRNSRFSFANLKAELGSTLMEVLVATSLLGIVAGGMAQFFRASYQIQKQAKVKATMQFIAIDIENKVKSASSIYLSLLDASNVNLVECVLGTGNGCTLAMTTFNPASAPSGWFYFALNYSTASTTAAPMTTANYAAPQYYDTSGLPCAAGSGPQCVFMAQTFFYASCDPADPNYPTCLTGPAEVHVAYSVSQVPGTLPGLGATLNTIPQSLHFYTHQTKDILGTFSSTSCNPGAVVEGYDRRGLATCKCAGTAAGGYVASGATNRFGPICNKILAAQLQCPTNTVFRGLADDGTANCVGPSGAYSCVPGSPVGSLSARCGSGYWVQEDVRSNCQYNCTMPHTTGKYPCDSTEPPYNGGANTVYNYMDIAPAPKYVNQCCISKNDNDYNNNPSVPGEYSYPVGLICGSRTLTCCRPM